MNEKDYQDYQDLGKAQVGVAAAGLFFIGGLAAVIGAVKGIDTFSEKHSIKPEFREEYFQKKDSINAIYSKKCASFNKEFLRMKEHYDSLKVRNNYKKLEKLDSLKKVYESKLERGVK